MRNVNNGINSESINREIRAMKIGAFKISDILDLSYEAKVRELLDLVVEKRQEFDNLSDLDKLIEYMVENEVPRSAQAVNYDGNARFDEKRETRKKTMKVAIEILELADNDYEKAIKIVKTMT